MSLICFLDYLVNEHNFINEDCQILSHTFEVENILKYRSLSISEWGTRQVFI